MGDFHLFWPNSGDTTRTRNHVLVSYASGDYFIVNPRTGPSSYPVMYTCIKHIFQSFVLIFFVCVSSRLVRQWSEFLHAKRQPMAVPLCYTHQKKIPCPCLIAYIYSNSYA